MLMITPSTALLNKIFAADPGPRMLTAYEIKLLRQSKKEIQEALRELHSKEGSEK
jgi:hypothetical protein